MALHKSFRPQRTAWEVVVVDGRICIRDAQDGSLPLHVTDDTQRIDNLHRACAGANGLSLLEDLAAALSTSERTQSPHGSRARKLVAEAHGIIATAVPSEQRISDLLRESGQLDLWGKAA